MQLRMRALLSFRVFRLLTLQTRIVMAGPTPSIGETGLFRITFPYSVETLTLLIILPMTAFMMSLLPYLTM